MRLITEALKDYDLASGDFQKLREFFDNANVGHLPLSSNWCGIAMFNWATRCGYETPPLPQIARSWLKAGKNTTAVPEIGDVCILWRESPRSWKGHVTILVQRIYNEDLLCLGGNQNGRVQFKIYHESRLLGFRRLG